MPDWKRVGEFVRVGSPWVTLVGERWLCDKGKELEYWRVEKADSVIVLPLQAGWIYCVAPSFRPGIARPTIDLPGGRLPADSAPQRFVPTLLQRELGIPPAAVNRIEPLNAEKWIVNSSFSNQGLWAFLAEIDERFKIPEALVGEKAAASAVGVSQLLAKLDCLQCRAVLLQWQQRLN